MLGGFNRGSLSGMEIRKFRFKWAKANTNSTGANLVNCVLKSMRGVACLAVILSQIGCLNQRPFALDTHKYRVIHKLTKIPEREIVFYALEMGGNTLGFVDADGSGLEYYRIELPYPITNNVRWSFDNRSITARVMPSTNPNASYPILIREDGTILYCEVLIGGGYVWGITDNLVITAPHDSNEIVILDMESCSVQSVLYRSDQRVSRLIVSRAGTMITTRSQKYVLLDEYGRELSVDIQGSPIEFSPGSDQLLLGDEGGLYIFDLQTQSRELVANAPGGWLSWSPDGKSIIGIRDSLRNLTITTFELSSGKTQKVVRNGLSPSWRTVP